MSEIPVLTPLCGMFLVATTAIGQITAPPTLGKMPKAYVAGFAQSAIRVDGLLDEAAWSEVPWTDDFVDIQGDRKPNPRFRTHAKMLWDSTYFYVAAELQEPDVWATLTKRDTVIFYDNDFEIFMDPDGDHHEYYELEMNALNTVWDLFLPLPYKDGGKAQDSWDIRGLRTAVHVQGTLNRPSDTDTGWTLEVAMPWVALGEFAHKPAPPREGDQWRINFSRVEYQVDTSGGRYRKRPGLPEDNWVWSPQGVIDMHRPEMWGYVQFTGKAAAGAAFRPDQAFHEKCLLEKVYYAEREFQSAHKRFTTSTEELLGSVAAPEPDLGKVKIVLTQEGYTASIRAPGQGGGMKSWHIRQDSRLWSD